MDNRAIGVFDSGLGGLTAVSALRRLLPNEDIVYLADTKNVPYGDKSREELIALAESDVNFLVSKDVKLILIACGTVSSTLSEEQMSSYGLRVVGVIDPAAKAAAEKSKNGKIGVIATAASIKSGAYKKKMLEIDRNLEVFDVACPKLVLLIESGKTEGAEVKEALCEYLMPLSEKGIDTLVLGCTHYPLLKKEVEAILPEAALIDVGEKAAAEVKEYLEKQNMLSQGGGEVALYCSGDCEDFKEKASRFLGYSIEKVYKAEK
ncbi:MAG: glutamate racemase [Oscillospiraceae bacterium]|nr:glutamate racemase [Oscillospiraceae bacterium]